MDVPLDLRDIVISSFAVAVVLVGVYLGSGGLRWLAVALAGYLVGVLLAVFTTVYRYLIWLQRPPTARMSRRGWVPRRR